MLSSYAITSVGLVEAYLDQIQRHDGFLHAMIQTTPRNLLDAAARALDDERKAGKSRGPLHGIPILIKDNIATHPNTGLRTTAGSLSLMTSKPKENAKLVDLLINAGAIILGKTNLSEFSNSRAGLGSMMPSGWSAVGGQVQSAYIRGGIDPNNSKDGHSNPSGSSSGSAVGVSAGYAPFSIGTETDGSLLCPAGRAALYTMKPTIGLVPQQGITPMSMNQDSAGPMTKTPYDLAILLDALASRDASNSYTKYLSGSWAGISVAFLNYSAWRFPDSIIKPTDGAEAQILKETEDVYDTIKTKAKTYVENVDLVTVDALLTHGKDSKDITTMADMKKDLTAYLQNLKESDMRTITDIIDFNNDHTEEELPPHHPRQDTFIKCQNTNVSQKEYDQMLAHMRYVARDIGVERIFKEYGVDVIIGPSDGFISTIAAAGAYPVAAMPLSYLEYNGRPFGLAALAGRYREGLLIEVMSAWEATFPPRKPPPELV